MKTNHCYKVQNDIREKYNKTTLILMLYFSFRHFIFQLNNHVSMLTGLSPLLLQVQDVASVDAQCQREAKKFGAKKMPNPLYINLPNNDHLAQWFQQDVTSRADVDCSIKLSQSILGSVKSF